MHLSEFTTFLPPLIFINGGSFIIDGCSIKKQNFSGFPNLISANLRQEFILRNFAFMENSLANKIFEITAFSIHFENITFYNNFFPSSMIWAIFELNSYLEQDLFNQAYLFINNSVFFQNYFSVYLLSVSNFGYVDIANSKFEGNFFMFGFDINSCDNIFFENIWFVKNNNKDTFEINSTEYEKFKEIDKTFGIYGVSIEIKIASYVQFVFLYFIKNAANLFQTTGFYIFECEYFYLADSQFIGNSLRTAGQNAGACFTIESKANGAIKLQRNYFFQNSVYNNLFGADEEFTACSKISMIYGNISLSDSLFYENLSPKYLCLGLRSNGIYVNNCSFINHTHTESDLVGLNYEKVGVLVVDFSDIIIKECFFAFNTALKGSALTVQRSNYKHQFLLTKNCTFLSNLAFSAGNSLYVYSSESFRLFIIDRCFFIKGISNKNSATISLGSQNGNFIQNFTCIECVFIQNMGLNSAAIFEYYPTYPLNTFLFFIDSLFLNNMKVRSSNPQGGLFDIWGEAFDETVAFYISNCIFKG